MHDTTQLEQTYKMRSLEYQQKLAAGEWDRGLQEELQQLEHQRRCAHAGAPGTPDASARPRNGQAGAKLPKKGVAPATRMVGRKLTAGAVLEIRAAWATGEVKRRELAARYGVAPGTISDIIHRRIWADLEEEVAA